MCFRHFGFEDLEQVDNFGVYDFSLRVKAHRLNEVDRQRDMHWMAMLIRNVKATNKKGEYVYPSFDDFFKESDWMDEADDESRETKRKVYKRLSDIAKEVNQKGG